MGDLFYCPACAGAGESAAAVAGGALTAATLGLVDLAKMPRSLKALRRVVANARREDPKFRRLRLANASVKRALDVPPARRCLASIGFVERQEDGETVLVCDDLPDQDILDDVAQLLAGLDDEDEPEDDATAKRSRAAVDRDEGPPKDEPDPKRPAVSG